MNFDRIASRYDLLASIAFFGRIKKSQIECLKAIPPQGKVLILGGGTGWIIPYVFNCGEVEKLYYIEASQKMLDIAIETCPLSMKKRVEFIFGDETNVPDILYDTVLTNFLLDCFTEARLKNVMEILYKRLKAGGLWYCVDFRIDQGKFRRVWQTYLAGLMFYFFKRTVRLESGYLVNFDVLLEEYGLSEIFKSDYFAGFITASVKAK